MDTVLVVDASADIRDLLGRSLARAGHRVACCRGLTDALRWAEEHSADAAVVDWDLPDSDGGHLLDALRRMSIPVLLLSAHADSWDRVHGLELGAEDYLAKPFSPRELELRVATVLRHGRTDPLAATWSFGSGRVTVDQLRHEVSADGRPVELTRHEWDLLIALATDPGRVLSRRELVRAAHGHGRRDCDCERTVDTHISNLRRRLGDGPRTFQVIETVAGAGYRFGLTADRPTAGQEARQVAEERPTHHRSVGSGDTALTRYPR